MAGRSDAMQTKKFAWRSSLAEINKRKGKGKENTPECQRVLKYQMVVNPQNPNRTRIYRKEFTNIPEDMGSTLETCDTRGGMRESRNSSALLSLCR